MIDATGMPQTAVVLGGSSDLARSLLAALAARRLEAVVLCGRDEARLAPVAEQLRGAGVKVTTERFDAQAAAEADELATRVRATLGTIDLVVVAAGDLGTAELAALDAKRISELLQANFVGPAAAMTSFAKTLRDQGTGLIVVYSSVAGLRVRRSNFPYGAAKAGLDGFAQGLGDALHGSGVRVLIVRPGFVMTKMTAEAATPPLKSTPEQVTADVLAGLERGRAVVTTPKLLVPLFVVLRTLPRAIWRRLPF